MADTPAAGGADNAMDVLRVAQLDPDTLREFLAVRGLGLVWRAADADLPGSYWGAPEAGLVGSNLYVRPDTPAHSLLHEAAHALCLPEAARGELHTDAGSDDLEEAAVCYLQVLLADALPGVGAARILADMDRWGYSYRLGSAHAWFESDADDARAWLASRSLLALADDPGSATGPAMTGARHGLESPPPLPHPESRT